MWTEFGAVFMIAGLFLFNLAASPYCGQFSLASAFIGGMLLASGIFLVYVDRKEH